MVGLTKDHGLYEIHLTEISLGTERENLHCAQKCTKRRMLFNT